MDYSKKTLSRFLGDLGSDAMSPGGGSAAALTGAMAAALIEMVCRLDAKRLIKKGLNGRASLKRAGFAAAIRAAQTRRVEEDMRAFLALTAIASDKRSGPVYLKAVKSCAEAPWRIADGCAKTAALCLAERPYVSQWLLSDLIESAVLSQAAFRSAILNVECNLGAISDPIYVVRLRRRIRQTRQAIDRACRRLQTPGGS